MLINCLKKTYLNFEPLQNLQLKKRQEANKEKSNYENVSKNLDQRKTKIIHSAKINEKLNSKSRATYVNAKTLENLQIKRRTIQISDFIDLSDKDGKHEKSKASPIDKDSSKVKNDIDLNKSLKSKKGEKEITLDFIQSQEKYDCVHCLKQFNEKDSLTSHIRKFHKIYELKCFKCRKFFDHSSELADHLISTHFYNIHKGDTHSWYKCSTCKQIFKQKESLATHTKSVHEGIKNKCVLCENMKTFRSNSSFINHLELVHKEKKIVTCILINMNRKSNNEVMKNLNYNNVVKKLQSRSLKSAVDQVDENEVIDLVDGIDETSFNQLTTPEILNHPNQNNETIF